MGRCIVITSGKGGVGKTTVTATLGLMLAKHDYKVALADADVTLNNLDLVLGLEDRISYDILDVAKGRCRLSQALAVHGSGLKLLASTKGGEVNTADFTEIILKLRERHDFVLIDCPAGVDDGFYRAVAPASEAIVVTTPSPSSLRDCDKAIKTLLQLKKASISTVVNRTRGDLVLGGEMLSHREIEDLLHTRVIGVLPDEDSILDVYGCLPNKGEFRRAITMLSKRLICGHGEIYDPCERYRGLSGGIKMLLRKLK